MPIITKAPPGCDGISLTPIPLRISALIQERNGLFAFPLERLATIISEIGFQCTCCAKCCTRDFNGHVFLLDSDVRIAREIDPEALEPAPNPEFCDQNGVYYVSGYAIRAMPDKHGSCWFLKQDRCSIYDRRFSICRIYPYMLHREADEHGAVDWRQFSGLDEHGDYHSQIPPETCHSMALHTVEYENAFLAHEIAFLEFIRDYFARNKLRHIQKIYDDGMRRFQKGEDITVMVFCDGALDKHCVHAGKNGSGRES